MPKKTAALGGAEKQLTKENAMDKIELLTALNDRGDPCVEYRRNGEIIARWSPMDALSHIIGLMTRIQSQPHVTTSVHVTIVGENVPSPKWN